MMGMFMASSLSARLRRLESCMALLAELYGRLEYLQPTVQGLIGYLAGQERFAHLTFLKTCSVAMLEGETFSASWQAALDEYSHMLGKEEVAILADLGGVLGQSNLENQLNAITLVRQRLDVRIHEVREKVVTQGKLYRSMGILGGAAAAIILI